MLRQTASKLLGTLPASRDSLRGKEPAIRYAMTRGLCAWDGDTLVRTDAPLPPGFTGPRPAELLTRGAFMAWKQSQPIPGVLDVDPENGEFTQLRMRQHAGVWAGAVETYLPVPPAPHVLEAMIDAGCRRDWADSIYLAARRAILSAG